MKQGQRPWWLIVLRSPHLVTTVREESKPNERRFIIRGEPVIHGLAWLIWGPVAALIAVLGVTGLAVIFEINEQPWTTRVLFIGAFLGLPALAWGAVTLVLNRLSEKYVQAEREAYRQEGLIGLNQARAELFYRLPGQAEERRLAYEDIDQARVTYPIGGGQGKAMCLTLDTNQGPIVLLNEALGTQAQKIDLVTEIQRVLELYSNK